MSDAARGKPLWVASAALLALAFIAQLNVVAFGSANWDEYRYLADVHGLGRDTLPSALQTLHARFYSWVALVAENEANQIRAARTVILILHAATWYLVFRVSTRFASSLAALLAALSYATFSYSLQHGTSFRADPMAAFLLMWAIERLTAPGERFANLIFEAPQRPRASTELTRDPGRLHSCSGTSTVVLRLRRTAGQGCRTGSVRERGDPVADAFGSDRERRADRRERGT